MSEVTDTLNCPSCNQVIDVTGLSPGTIIECPHCSHSFSTWAQFDNYRLETMLGEGGMGSVYRATDINLNRVVAIKVLKPELSDDKKFVETFVREVEITAQLTHPNIVQVYSFGKHNDQYYLAMEFINSQTLDDDIITRRQLPEFEVIDIAIGVAQGLNFALQRGGLIHRDIKPGNMLFGAGRTPKVVDFGLALTPETADNDSGEIWGTPYYISPERLEGRTEDFRSDLYSLGVTLYHAVAGRPPFDAETAEIVAAKHLSERPLPLQTYAPHISETTCYAIARAMARHPEERFNTYQEFIEQLEDAKRRLQDMTSTGTATSYEVVQTGFADQNLLIIAGVTIGIIILFVGGFFLYLNM